MIKKTILTKLCFFVEKLLIILENSLTKTMGKCEINSRIHYLGYVNGGTIYIMFNSYFKDN
jgi:hypothetical protein